MKRLLCIGHLNVEDTVYFGRPPFLKAPGGAVLYTATAARIWDVSVSIVSRAGQDYPPEFLAAMQQGGVDTSYIRHVPGQTMAGRTSYQSDGGRKYEMYAGAARRLELTPQPGDWPQMTKEKWDAAHIATMPPFVQSEWLDQLRPHVPLISLDTDISFIQNDRSAFAALLSQVDVVFPNHQEAVAFAAVEDLDQAAEIWLAHGLRILVIKRGEQGVSVYTRSAPPLHLPAIKVSTVDVTGAGDSFAGGFLAGCLATGTVAQAALRGVISAALAIQNYGALHTLHRRAEGLSTFELIQSHS